MLYEFSTGLAKLMKELSIENITKPKVMILTCKQPWEGWDGYSEIISVNDNTTDPTAKINEWLAGPGEDGAALDGIYLQFEETMLNKETGGAVLRKWCNEYFIGVWTGSGDPDSKESVTEILSTGVKFLNTDLPHGFIAE